MALLFDAEGFLEDSSAIEAGYSGTLKVVTSTIKFSAGADIGSTGRFFRLPTNARLQHGSVVLVYTAGGLSLFNMGVFLPGRDRYDSGLSFEEISLAGTESFSLVDSIDKWNVPIWNFVGEPGFELDEDPKGFVDIVGTVTLGADTGGAEIVVSAHYTLP